MCVVGKFSFCGSFCTYIICVTNVIMSVCLCFLQKRSVLDIVCDKSDWDTFSTLEYGITLIASVCALCGLTYLNLYFMFPLLTSDLWRLGNSFIHWHHCRPEEAYLVAYNIYVVYLLFSITVGICCIIELSKGAARPKPRSTITSGPRASSQSHQSATTSRRTDEVRAYVRGHPPKYFYPANVYRASICTSPPTSATVSAPVTVANSAGVAPAHSAGGSAHPEDLPPSYAQVCSGNFPLPSNFLMQRN